MDTDLGSSLKPNPGQNQNKAGAGGPWVLGGWGEGCCSCGQSETFFLHTKIIKHVPNSQQLARCVPLRPYTPLLDLTPAGSTPEPWLQVQAQTIWIWTFKTGKPSPGPGGAPSCSFKKFLFMFCRVLSFTQNKWVKTEKLVLQNQDWRIQNLQCKVIVFQQREIVGLTLLASC